MGGDIKLTLSSLAGSVGEAVVQRTSLGHQVKEEIEKATDGNFKALSTRIILEQGEEFHNKQQLSDVVSDAATEAAVMLIRGGPYDATYTIEVKWNGPRNVTIFGGVARLESGDFPIEWDLADPSKCSFSVHRRGGTIWAAASKAAGVEIEEDLKEEYRVEFLGAGPEDGLEGSFQRTHEGSLSIKGRVAKE